MRDKKDERGKRLYAASELAEHASSADPFLGQIACHEPTSPAGPGGTPSCFRVYEETCFLFGVSHSFLFSSIVSFSFSCPSIARPLTSICGVEACWRVRPIKAPLPEQPTCQREPEGHPHHTFCSSMMCSDNGQKKEEDKRTSSPFTVYCRPTLLFPWFVLAMRRRCRMLCMALAGSGWLWLALVGLLLQSDRRRSFCLSCLASHALEQHTQECNEHGHSLVDGRKTRLHSFASSSVRTFALVRYKDARRWPSFVWARRSTRSMSRSRRPKRKARIAQSLEGAGGATTMTTIMTTPPQIDPRIALLLPPRHSFLLCK